MYMRALRNRCASGKRIIAWGLTDLKLSAYGDAVRALRRAVELEPNNSDAASKLADLLMLGSSELKHPPLRINCTTKSTSFRTNY